MSSIFYDFQGNMITQAQWAKIFRSGKKRVSNTLLPNYRISTVWTGLNFTGDLENPMIFETMVFPIEGYRDIYSERHSTVQEAQDRHEAIVEMVRSGEITGE